MRRKLKPCTDKLDFNRHTSLEILVERFKNNEYGIEELQSRLNTAVMPDPPITEISNRLLDLDNDLEIILYTQSDSEQYQLAVNVRIGCLH
ncbi:hypothetical protein UQ64_14700 [Paenibacillus etheri]|uniref:Uncharacterized protein n=1 Tax=Paenibacillus etheri TaxID=1306852 RepID=A0A0W1AZG5_9BACL|nr:hypothetical protein UQ64_14700 [Paenibacillus etheri]